MVAEKSKIQTHIMIRPKMKKTADIILTRLMRNDQRERSRLAGCIGMTYARLDRGQMHTTTTRRAGGDVPTVAKTHYQ
jgi:hypothetical protein